MKPDNDRFFELVGEALREVCSQSGAVKDLGQLNPEQEEQLAYNLASTAIEMATAKYNREKRLAEILEYDKR